MEIEGDGREMRYCPNCGNKLSKGVSRCWNPECGLQFSAPNQIDDMTIPVPKSDKLRELELEYALAIRGFSSGMPAIYAAILSGLMSLLAFAAFLVMASEAIHTGNQLVFIIGIFSTAFIIYLAFVFGRAASIRARINKRKKDLQIEADRRVE